MLLFIKLKRISRLDFLQIYRNNRKILKNIIILYGK